MQQQPEDILVLDTLRAMRQITNLVPRGYHRHVAGIVPVDRAVRMVKKFMEIYGVMEPRALERRRRLRGETIARLILCPDGKLEDRRLRWVMLGSDHGAGPITIREQLANAKDKRHRIRVGWYELVRVPRTDMRPAWTWRVPPTEWQAHVAHACGLARHASPAQAQALIDREMRRPGFRGLRRQRHDLFRAMWLARGPRQPPLRIPARIPWVGMVRADGVRLKDYVRDSSSPADQQPPHGRTPA